MKRLLPLAAVLVLLPVLALAADPAATANAVDFGPLLNTGIGLIEAAIVAVLGFVSLYIKRKWGLDTDLKHNAVLNDALDAAAHWAIARLGPKSRVEISNDLVRLGARYAATGAPQALAYFGITDARLEQMIEARLAKLLPPAPAPA